MDPSKMQVIPQRRSGKSEAVLQDMGKLLQEHPELSVRIEAQNAAELAQELPEDVGHRVFPRPDFSAVEELRDCLRRIVHLWIAERPTEITESAFLYRFPVLEDVPYLSKALQPLLAEQLKQRLPADVQSRASVDAFSKASPAEELSDSLRPLVRKWIAERPVKIRLGAFFQRFPEIPDTFLTEKLLMPMLAEHNPEYRGGWEIEWDYVPHDFIMKLIKSPAKHSKNNVE